MRRRMYGSGYTECPQVRVSGGSGGMNVYIRDGPVRRNIQGWGSRQAWVGSALGFCFGAER